VGTPAATLEVLLARIDRLEQKLDAALKPTPAFLSKRAAAKLLGVDRGMKLQQILQAGRVRLVPVGGQLLIPRAEVERVISSGLAETTRAAAPKKPSARATRRATPAEIAKAIRAIPIPEDDA
jgi:hypothetical protein